MSVVRETSEVLIEPAVALSMPEREPIEREPKNPLVDEAYEEERLVVDAFWKVWSAEKVLVVYVLGIVVEELMYEFTPVLKFDTCELVIERQLQVQLEPRSYLSRVTSQVFSVYQTEALVQVRHRRMEKFLLGMRVVAMTLLPPHLSA